MTREDLGLRIGRGQVVWDGDESCSVIRNGVGCGRRGFGNDGGQREQRSGAEWKRERRGGCVVMVVREGQKWDEK